MTGKTAERDDAALEQFVWSNIDSVGLLELLLLLKNDETRHWTPQQASIELRSAIESTKQRLEKLKVSGLIVSEPAGYHYAPSSEEKRRLVHALSEAYRQRRVSTITLIFQRPPESVMEFADAFRLAKDK